MSSMAECHNYRRQHIIRRVHKMRKATISFAMSVRPPFRMEQQLVPHWTDFHEIWYFSIFETLQKFQSSLKSDSTIGHFTCRPTYIQSWQQLDEFFLEWGMFLTKVVQKIKIHFVFSEFFFRKSCTLWDNAERYCRADRSQVTIKRMRISRCIPKATHTDSEHVIFIAFPPQHWMHERAPVLRHA